MLLTGERNSLDQWQAMRTMASLWTELETIANAMDQILTGSLTEAAEESIQEARDQITNLTDAWRQQADAEIFPQLEAAAGQFDAKIMGQFDSLLGEFAELANRAEVLVAESQSLLEPPSAGDHLVTIDGQPMAAIPGPGDYPDEFVEGETDVDAVIQDQNWEVEHQGLGDQLTSLTNAAPVRTEEAEVLFSSQADQLQTSVDGSRTLAEQIASQAAELAARSESWADGVEASRIRAEMDLQNQLANVRTMMDQVAPLLAHATAQLEQSAAKVAGLPNSDSRCQVTPKHQFQGGAGLDIFFPFSSPFQSWSISGGAGTDILFGGFVDDIISGGAGSDWLFGLRGNDLIHGDDGTDFLFGEFLVDIPFFSGDDCVYGDDGTDLIMGDNAIDTGNIGGKDDLHGGKGVDIVLGDDLTDVFTNGPGDNDTIHGDDDLDILFATGGNDTVFGGLHIDAMFGGQGDDTLYANDSSYLNDGLTIGSTPIVIGSLQVGGAGADTIYGANGIDVQVGGTDQDTIYGKDYIDFQLGGPDNDTMYGESGGALFMISNVPIRFGNIMLGGTELDQMWGGGDLDIMLGGSHDDTMYGYDGNFELFGIDGDIMFGGTGNDTMEGDDESLLLLTSHDWMWGQDGDDTIRGGRQGDFLFGGNGDDTITGDSEGPLLLLSNDLIVGGDGNDTLQGGNGIDVMLGGNGDDDMTGDNESLWLVTSADWMFGGDGNDTMRGGSQSDKLFGQQGNDLINGDSNSLLLVNSNDLMLGGAGNDTMDGGNGKDLILGQDGDDRIQGDASSFGMVTSQDLVFGGDGDDYIDGGVNQDLLFGQAGCDYMLGDNGASWMILSLDVMHGGSGCDEMYGGRSADLMFGGGDIDTMDGQWGLDIMAGNDGTDRMNGGDFADIMTGGNDGDVMHGNDGPDLILGQDGDDCLYGDDGLDILFGGNGNDCMYGGNFLDWMYGGSGNDTMFGEAGPDMMFGQDGHDRMDGGSSADVMSGGSGNDQMWGGPGWDALFGNGGNDTLIGGSGADLLVGGSGSDSKTQGGSDSSGLSCSCVILPCKFDFGDAPNSYSTLLPNGPRHGLAGPRLGSSIDDEANGQPTVGANGDDTNSVDDEDGVSLSALTAGSTTVISVSMSNAANARLDAWVDFNANGIFDHPLEQVAAGFPLVPGSNSVPISIPGSATLGNTYARFRVSLSGGLTPLGMALDGEVEDYAVQIRPREPELDFSDAPDSYGTTLANNGARHLLGGPQLGTVIDAEPDGQPSVGAFLDDNVALDDEEGIMFFPMTPGGQTEIGVTLSNATNAVVDGWMDFNGNGVFDHPAEQILAAQPIFAGINFFGFTVPASSVISTYARFRVSTSGVAGPTGFGGPGEVEDYRVGMSPGTGIGGLVGFEYDPAPFAQVARAADTFLPSHQNVRTIDLSEFESLPDNDTLLAAHGIAINNRGSYSMGQEGDPTSVEQLDGFDGQYLPDGDRVLVKLDNDAGEALEIVFDQLVSGVTGFIGTGAEGTIETITVSAFDVDGHLLFSYPATVHLFADSDNREGFFGVRTEDNQASIKSIQLRNNNPTPFGNALLLGPLHVATPATNPADFSGDGQLDVSDLNLLLQAIAGQDSDARFDLNGDGLLDSQDQTVMLRDYLHTERGDANLDGVFDTSDLVLVFIAGLYETGQSAQWQQGDWNGDGFFGTADLIAAFQVGWYESGPLMRTGDQ
ncbi:MAG: GEVED domain-containing protein [Pirellulaceae bacterium]